ncbi:hypothetical protein AVEN_144243-1 [Araneus ventricosus]|uniref:Uncharacterized protein n=1 Tax=Araneus ventricosus TaxID=182803 RepID=A0A4Y2PW70_ARAVE|nr:hypothetical protein AVEN_100651-1 [Araneus ventricosus]GBN55457.1 hypothetical protein AVEN_260026-1 [Araneus ventricosus]GBN55485.1 hypothetical protein AVEN_144243-1 [Araneus ventricosus]
MLRPRCPSGKVSASEPKDCSWYSPNSKNPLLCSPNPSGRATLTKKERAVVVKSITLNERRWKLHNDIRTSTVFCSKGRLGRSPIDRVKEPEVKAAVVRKFEERDASSALALII